MSDKRILTIGLELASTDIQYAIFQSKMSLLDWDIVLFKPQIGDFTSYGEHFQGKPSLKRPRLFQLKECCEHWRREIKQAVETGKTIIVFLPSLEEVYVTRESGPTPVLVGINGPPVTSRSTTTTERFQLACRQ